MLLRFDVTDRNIVCRTPDVSKLEDPILYVKCSFNFTTSVWSSMEAVVAIFKSASYGHTAEAVLDSSGSCFIPPEVYKHGGVVQVILYGDKYTADNKRLTSDYIGPANVFFGHNVVLPIPLPSKYDVFVAEFSNIKNGLDETVITVNKLLENFNDIEDAYVDEEYHLVIKFSHDPTYRSVQSLQGPKGESGTTDYEQLEHRPRAINSSEILAIVNMN